MKAKVMRSIYMILAAASLVLVTAEADTGLGQLIWSGSWMAVLVFSAKRFGKYMDQVEKEKLQ